MRVLMVCPHVPYPLDNGGSIRTFHIATGLAERHELRLLAMTASEPPMETRTALESVFREATYITHRPNRALCAALGVAGKPFALRCYWSDRVRATIERAAGDSDVVLFTSLHTAQYALEQWPPYAVDSQNVEHVQWRRYAELTRNPFVRAYCLRQSALLRKWERRMVGSVDAMFACSPIDAALLGPETIVAPNGVDLTPGIHRNPEPATFVYIGDMGWRPNIDAVRHFATAIFPQILAKIPTARFEIVGKDPPNSVSALANEHIAVTGRVDSVSPYLSRATALVVPLRSGSGTRIKILEAFAAGVPVVSTTIGCEGLEIANEKELLIADTPDAFTAACLRIAREPALAERLTQCAAELVRAKYTWQHTVDVIEQTLIAITP